ncbi:hypothetical protein ACIQ4I_01800 [Rummeliibacillus sp. NPDC094406]|uniref:hypothetical protein n=1 Tax=Rummeliibacillus sp. NPDC094406 TaxID=3364511 RepID=UPI00383014E5
MRKYSGILSILFLLFGVSTIYFAKYIPFFADYMLQIMIITYIVAWLLALLSEKGIWKKVSLVGLVFISLVVIVLFVVMTLLWNKP